MQLRSESKIDVIADKQWDILRCKSFPFSTHAFLSSLEESCCVGEESGWKPCHLSLWDKKKLAGAICLYEKNNGYGEYIFDHSWANAFENAGGRYYPKLICAIPFTPATGPRIMINPENKDSKKIFELIIKTYELIVRNNKLSSAHINLSLIHI